jgi:predicted 3-demethylubiquinone-9 3-methyltransferase (glyoxalase superfamily)
MSRITTCLWFDSDGEKAARFYVEIFRANGRQAEVGKIAHYGPGGPKPEGEVLTVAFTLDGQDFLALNGGPIYQFTPAISMMIECADQGEVDGFWDCLLDGGQAVQCGWATDRFGLSWQVVPKALPDLLSSGSAEQRKRVFGAMMGMVKLDIAALERARDAA